MLCRATSHVKRPAYIATTSTLKTKFHWKSFWKQVLEATNYMSANRLHVEKNEDNLEEASN
jgi:hypothetical protein